MYDERTMFVISSVDLEEMIYLIYGQTFYFMVDLSIEEYEDRYYYILKNTHSPVTSAEVRDFERINKFIETGEYNYLTFALLRDMINFDFIPEGEWRIKGNW